MRGKHLDEHQLNGSKDALQAFVYHEGLISSKGWLFGPPPFRQNRSSELHFSTCLALAINEWFPAQISILPAKILNKDLAFSQVAQQDVIDLLQLLRGLLRGQAAHNPS